MGLWMVMLKAFGRWMQVAILELSAWFTNVPLILFCWPSGFLGKRWARSCANSYLLRVSNKELGSPGQLEPSPCPFKHWFVWQAKWILQLVKVSQMCGFRIIFKTSESKDLQRCMSCSSAVQETSSSEMLGGQGADFLRRVAFWSIRPSGLLRWFCVTVASLFLGSHSTFNRWSGNITKRATPPPSLHSTFHFWRKSRRIASLSVLSTSKLEEVSQNFSIASFWTFQLLGLKEVSQNCFVSDRWIDR